MTIEPLIAVRTSSAVIKIRRRNDGLLTLRYPDGHEVVSLISEVRHPIIREVLLSRKFQGGLDLITGSGISSPADVALALGALEEAVKNF